MKETQKAKIARLEAENQFLKDEIEALQKKYYTLMEKADDAVLVSPAYQQLQKDLLVQEELAKTYKSRLATNEEIRFRQAEKLAEFQKLINENTVKNPRNAGRKPKLTNDEILEIKRLRKNGKSVREIAESFHCSTGLVSQVSRLIDMIPEDEPLPDEIESIAEAKADKSATITHNSINWD